MSLLYHLFLCNIHIYTIAKTGWNVGAGAATHCVPVPVEESTCPEVPVEPPAVSVPDTVAFDSVSPEIVVTVAPEAIDVEPSVGAEYEEIPVTVAPVKSTVPVNVGSSRVAVTAESIET
jgi:hypothetical protein